MGISGPQAGTITFEVDLELAMGLVWAPNKIGSLSRYFRTDSRHVLTNILKGILSAMDMFHMP